jgi:hypothetical protein
MHRTTSIHACLTIDLLAFATGISSGSLASGLFRGTTVVQETTPLLE